MLVERLDWLNRCIIGVLKNTAVSDISVNSKYLEKLKMLQKATLLVETGEASSLPETPTGWINEQFQTTHIVDLSEVPLLVVD